MRLIFRATLCAICLLCMIGCSTVQVMQPPSAKTLTRHVEPGDTVLITMKDNSYFHMRVTAIEADRITGLWPKNNQSYTKLYADIRKIEVEEFSWAKTIGAAAGTYIVLGIIATGVFAYALEHADFGSKN